MKTPWTDSVDRLAPLPEYPRPQMVRGNWLSLNGPWEYAISAGGSFPAEYDGTITVPFSPETELSGVGRTLHKGEFLWYRREISLPECFAERHVLLHFGAVDQTADVWVNGLKVMEHVGGYLPFEGDVTRAVRDGRMEIVVRVTDESDRGYHTRGKQKSARGGIWYTPQSGIWQSVWIEAVPENYVKKLHISPDFDSGCVDISAETVGNEAAYAHFGGGEYRLPARIPVPDFEPWSPENPKLYDFTVSCGEDSVESYFAMRKFSVEKDRSGKPRLFLNGRPYFHNGLLDQGYWPDGLYTAPTDEAMIFDIETAKAMGFNVLRKHIKVEPLRWYYHCDRLGMLVWQDMPCGGGRYDPVVVSAPLVTDIHLKDSAYLLFGRESKAGRGEFMTELRAMVQHLYNCPCIAMWVPFNEGWGQFDAARAVGVIHEIDTSRTVDHASGWHDQGIGETKSLHVYFRPYVFKPDRRGRAVILTEFGGYNCLVPGHSFNDRDFGYKRLGDADKLRAALEELYSRQIAPAYEQGLAAAIYTQVSDVEDELNGLITYDRQVVKIPPETVRNIVKVD
ncbi:MAG: glycoside hydrolase family 2 TIM barrel-domain containing protein [Eubacteriales bacterium]|nr:glycoside hydrolase family 2 TIM barrel-domain containing protein [Eubacteriales bacterium]